jgi:hypothetical protein
MPLAQLGLEAQIFERLRDTSGRHLEILEEVDPEQVHHQLRLGV